jgi:isopenicillin N synthase-like dioxygenase
MSSFPVVDLAASETSIAREMDRICRATGFLAVTGHGVAPSLVEETWAAARAFFDLPLEAKMRVRMPFTGYPYGYSPYAGEALAQSRGSATPPDLKESYSIGPEATWDRDSWDESQGFSGAPTLWSSEPPELRRIFSRYFSEMGALSSRILSLFALALDLPRDFFRDKIDRHASALRALNYPALEAKPQPGQLRAGAHSDYGSLTILLAEQGSRGLEIQSPEGGFEPVPIDAGSFIVNIGDLLARWSDDRWVSTVHRCSCEASGVRRQSIAFFHLPNWDAEIRCAKYPTVQAGAYLMEKFRSAVAIEETT